MLLGDLIGQKTPVTRLQELAEFVNSTEGLLGHILFVGDDGMGKASIAKALANQLDVAFYVCDASMLQQQGDLTAIITNLRERQVLLMERIHLLDRFLVERLRTALRDSKLEITIGQGKAARKHDMEIRPFTLIGTCPQKADCSPSLATEFSLILSAQPYSALELRNITQAIALKRGVDIDEGAAMLLAENCDGRPGHLDQLFQRFARAINKKMIKEQDILNAFQAFGIPTKRIKETNGNFDLQSLSGQDFEQLITALLSRMGFLAEMTKTSGDGGIDIVAAFDMPIFGGRYLFQCKRFAPDNLVGAPTVRDFFGAVTAERAVKGIFVTTSDFTAQARDFAQKAGVELIGSVQLQALLRDFGLIDGQIK